MENDRSKVQKRKQKQPTQQEATEAPTPVEEKTDC